MPERSEPLRAMSAWIPGNEEVHALGVAARQYADCPTKKNRKRYKRAKRAYIEARLRLIADDQRLRELVANRLAAMTAERAEMEC